MTLAGFTRTEGWQEAFNRRFAKTEYLGRND